MEITEDLYHMRELCSRYYNTKAPRVTNMERPVIPTPPTSALKLNLLPYFCCGVKFDDLELSLSHYFKAHFKTTQSVTRLSSFKSSDIGNPNIALLFRTAIFLKSLKTLPSNPKHFRPFPKTRSPPNFKNPYSATMAMAYDFLEVVKQTPTEYSEFVLMLENYVSVSNFIDILPYWGQFMYPKKSFPPTGGNNDFYSEPNGMTSRPLVLLKRPSLPYQNISNPIRFLYPNRRLSNQMVSACYFCREPSCGLIFSNQNDLRFHIISSHLSMSANPPI